jgi:hypothetical protein
MEVMPYLAPGQGYACFSGQTIGISNKLSGSFTLLSAERDQGILTLLLAQPVRPTTVVAAFGWR